MKVKNREGEIQRGAVVTFVQTGKGNKKRECLCRQEIDEAVNRISGEYFLFKR